METKNNSKDLFGIAPYGEALKIAVEKSFEGVSTLLGKVCLPAAEELGLMYRDKIKFWRLKNIIAIIEKAQGKLKLEGNELQLAVHPKIIHDLMEDGSLCDDEDLQEMWAGLFTSSCSADGNDTNILFTQKLKQLTSVQAKIINHICQICDVTFYKTDLLAAKKVTLTLEELYKITGVIDIEQLDFEMDSLRANELITAGGGGFSATDYPLVAKLRPSPFLLQLYAKTQGYNGSLKKFYSDRLTPYDPNDPDNYRVLLG